MTRPFKAAGEFVCFLGEAASDQVFQFKRNVMVPHVAANVDCRQTLG